MLKLGCFADSILYLCCEERSFRSLDTIVCSGALLWLFSPAHDDVKLRDTLKFRFPCPFVATDPTNIDDNRGCPGLMLHHLQPRRGLGPVIGPVQHAVPGPRRVPSQRLRPALQVVQVPGRPLLCKPCPESVRQWPAKTWQRPAKTWRGPLTHPPPLPIWAFESPVLGRRPGSVWRVRVDRVQYRRGRQLCTPYKTSGPREADAEGPAYPGRASGRSLREGSTGAPQAAAWSPGRRAPTLPRRAVQACAEWRRLR